MLNPTKTQRSIRARAITLKSKTDDWIITSELWKAIDNEKWNIANKMLDKIKKVWPNDPMVIYVDTLIFSTQKINKMVRK